MMHHQRNKTLGDSHNHERWLISYADFMTLLFGFFVVMYAISSVNEGKYKVLSNALNEVFAQRNVSLAPIQVGETTEPVEPSPVPTQQPQTQKDTNPGDTFMQSLATQAQDRLAGVLGKGDFDVKGNDQWLEINLDAAVLFETGEASLGPLAHDVLNAVVEMLGDAKNPVTVEGYTDNVPIATNRYASNWELSAARAAAVVRTFAGLGIDPDRLAAVGYGERHPVATNATPEGRAHNRRVTILVARSADAQRGMTTIGAERSKPLDIEWRDEKNGDTAPVSPDAVQAVRLESGGIRFTNESAPPQPNTANH
jgi:chemotaxis protein MotB